MNPETTKKLIGQRIAIARKASGLTQAQLAELIGVDKMTISKWERGLRAPSGEYLVALIESLHCTGDFLLGFSDTLQLHRD